MRAPYLQLLAGAALLTGCSRIPAPDQMATPDERVTSLVRALEDPIREDGVEAHRPELDGVIREIQRTYGERSPEYAQARTEAALMVYDARSAQEAVKFFREWLQADIAVYGHDHRETAFALTDYGTMQLLTGRSEYRSNAMRLLREALDVRRRVLGEQHPETAASEGFVADELLAECMAAPPCMQDDPRLIEALLLAERSSKAFLAVRPGSSPSRDRDVGVAKDRLFRIRAQMEAPADKSAGLAPTAISARPTR